MATDATTTPPAAENANALSRIDLPIEGMTCASCANRVEKSLNTLAGVEATVNFATKRATVSFDGAVVSPEELAAAVDKTGYKAHLPPAAAVRDGGTAGAAHAHDHSAHLHGDLDALRRRVTVSALLTAPLLLLSMAPALQFDYWQWVSLGLALPVVFWGGWPIHRATWVNLRHGVLTMDTLITLGTFAALAWSLYALLLGDAGDPQMRMRFALLPGREMSASHIYLETAAVVTTLILLGRYFEARATRRAGAAIASLLELGAKEATVLGEDGAEHRVPIEQLAVGDRFVVRPGEKIATDGVVVAGDSAVDMSMLTGESAPEDVAAGAILPGAAINQSGRLVVEATRVGADTALAQIARLVNEAQTGKSASQRLADRVSAVFVPAVVVVALATLAFWLIDGAGSAFAFSAAVAVLIIACPCALGLATPTALMVGTGRGAQLGLLIKGPRVLESTRQIDAIVLDKTGTLTTGRMNVSAAFYDAGVDEAAELALVATVENASEHPVARAIVRFAGAAGAAIGEPQSFLALPGLGVEGMVDGARVVIGKPSNLVESGVELAPALAASAAAAEARGETVVAAARKGRVRALFAVADTIKPTSARAVDELRAMGLKTVLLTGDNAKTAAEVAEATGVDEFIAEVLPADKAERVRALQRPDAHAMRVAMVGDGVNDAPALAQADLGVAIGTGADVAIEASDLTIVSGEPLAIVDAIRLSKATLRTIRQNLGWAFGYNAAAIPLAAAGLLSPAIAGAAMAFSSVSVVLNALRLRRFRPLPR